MMIAVEVCGGDKPRLKSHGKIYRRRIRSRSVLDQERDIVIIGKLVCDEQVASTILVEVACCNGSRIIPRAKAARSQQSARAVPKSDGDVIRNYVQLAVLIEIACDCV